MTNRLVPYQQDDQKWLSHYMAQAMKQVKPKEMMKPVKDKALQPNYVLPTLQMVAQAKSALKRHQKETPVFNPIKVIPEFESDHTTAETTKGGRRKKGKQHQAAGKPRKKQRRERESFSEDEEDSGDNEEDYDMLD